MKSWLFQSNPILYDIESSVMEQRDMTWVVKQYHREIKTGDRAYIWESGHPGGIIASGNIESDPIVRSEDPRMTKYMRPAYKFKGPTLRVELKLDRVFLPARLDRSTVKQDPTLSSLTILRFANATNYPLTNEHVKAIEAHIAKGLNASLETPSVPHFNPGVIYKRKDLHDRFGGQERGGICTPAQYPFVILFTGNAGNEFGYKDGWKGDIFEYTGEGQVGDMTFTKGNKAIRDHIKNNEEIHLFEDAGAAHVRYIGSMVYQGYEDQKGRDREGNERNIFVFKLRPKEVAYQDWDDGSEDSSGSKKISEDKIKEIAKDAGFQHEILETTKPVVLPDGAILPPNPRKRKGFVVYPRNPGIALKRLQDAGYVCEVDPQHPTFKTRATGQNYVEAHHLIPMSKQKDYPDKSLDVYENILVLCPFCHRKFHHGVHAPDFALIKKFYDAKIDTLKRKRKIDISFEQLKECYS